MIKEFDNDYIKKMFEFQSDRAEFFLIIFLFFLIWCCHCRHEVTATATVIFDIDVQND